VKESQEAAYFSQVCRRRIVSVPGYNIYERTEKNFLKRRLGGVM
jgi:hypothetical protein